MHFDPVQIEQALDRVASGEWSRPSTFDGTGVHHGYRRVAVVSAGSPRPVAEHFGFILDEIGSVWAAWLSWIDPGGFIVSHHDAGPWRERWQVPLRPAGTFTQADDTFVPVAGFPFRVAQWACHSVANETETPRVHLVVERDVFVDYSAAPFQLCQGECT
jgi:hypothetical protein